MTTFQVTHLNDTTKLIIESKVIEKYLVRTMTADNCISVLRELIFLNRLQKYGQYFVLSESMHGIQALSKPFAVEWKFPHLGQTLKEFCETQVYKEAPPEQIMKWSRFILKNLVEALDILHVNQLFHDQVTSDNILLTISDNVITHVRLLGLKNAVMAGFTMGKHGLNLNLSYASAEKDYKMAANVVMDFSANTLLPFSQFLTTMKQGKKSKQDIHKELEITVDHSELIPPILIRKLDPSSENLRNGIVFAAEKWRHYDVDFTRLVFVKAIELWEDLAEDCEIIDSSDETEFLTCMYFAAGLILGPEYKFTKYCNDQLTENLIENLFNSDSYDELGMFDSIPNLESRDLINLFEEHQVEFSKAAVSDKLFQVLKTDMVKEVKNGLFHVEQAKSKANKASKSLDLFERVYRHKIVLFFDNPAFQTVCKNKLVEFIRTEIRTSFDSRDEPKYDIPVWALYYLEVLFGPDGQVPMCKSEEIQLL